MPRSKTIAISAQHGVNAGLHHGRQGTADTVVGTAEAERAATFCQLISTQEPAATGVLNIDRNQCQQL